MTTSVITPGCIGEVMNTKVDVKPEVGMGATMFVGSDCYAMIVTKVHSSKNVEVAHVPDEYLDRFSVDENGVMRLSEELALKIYNNFGSEKFSKRKNGRWLPKGASLWSTGAVRFGHAENYRDPSF